MKINKSLDSIQFQIIFAIFLKLSQKTTKLKKNLKPTDDLVCTYHDKINVAHFTQQMLCCCGNGYGDQTELSLYLAQPRHLKRTLTCSLSDV